MRLLIVATVLLAGMAGRSAAEDLGEAVFSYTSEGPVMALEPGHFYSVGTFSGILDFADDKAVLDGAAQDCIGYVDVAEMGGHCVIPAGNGARLFVEWICGPPDPALAAPQGAMFCSHIIVGGTDAFEGATGTADAISVETSIRVDDTNLGHDIYSSSGRDTYLSFDLVLGGE